MVPKVDTAEIYSDGQAEIEMGRVISRYLLLPLASTKSVCRGT
jgi:aryl-alcohol dehydrogenase-like predicted oxidoreductase